MPVRFLVEENAISAPRPDPIATKLAHERLLRTWLDYGALVYNQDTTRLMAALESLPSGLRKLWQEAFKSAKFRRIARDLGSAEALFDNLEKVISVYKDINLVCLEEIRAQAYHLDDNEYCRFIENQNLEICRFDAIDRSNAFVGFAALWGQLIVAGTPRTNIWSRWFEGFNNFAKHIAIVDRYAGLNALQRHAEGKVSGIEMYLRLLDGLRDAEVKKKILTIYTSDKANGADLETLMRKITSLFKRNLSSVSLFIAPDREFATAAHDRYIRYDATIVTLGTGLSIFEETHCTLNCTCGLRVDLEGDYERAVERRLRPKSVMKSIL